MSPPSSSAALRKPEPEPMEYSWEERQELLRLAHEAVLAALQVRELDVSPPSPHLAEPRGAFTTLHLDGELRGCVGYVFPVHSLYRTVAETAVAAALHDTRFPQVTLSEAARLQIEISVLSPLTVIEPEEIEIGRHGLVITYGMCRGLLLPQVAVEHGWERETFLRQTCIKAGVPPDAWQRGALIEAFSAEVFGEEISGNEY